MSPPASCYLPEPIRTELGSLELQCICSRIHHCRHRKQVEASPTACALRQEWNKQLIGTEYEGQTPGSVSIMAVGHQCLDTPHRDSRSPRLWVGTQLVQVPQRVSGKSRIRTQASWLQGLRPPSCIEPGGEADIPGWGHLVGQQPLASSDAEQESHLPVRMVFWMKFPVRSAGPRPSIQ